MTEIIPQKKYLVFAGSTDDESQKLGLDDLIGEMTLADAYNAIKQYLAEHEYGNTGEVAVIEDGKLIARKSYFRGTTSSNLGIHLRGGFSSEDGTILFENETTPFALSPDEIDAAFKLAIETEGGVFSHTDFSISGRMSANGSLGSDRVSAYLRTDRLFGTPESAKRAIENATIIAFTNHRDWVARGKPKTQVTGMIV